jgi:hypothetical protein
VSVGGALARVAWGAVLAVAESMKGGSFAGLANAASGKMLNETFRMFRTVTHRPTAPLRDGTRAAGA